LERFDYSVKLRVVSEIAHILVGGKCIHGVSVGAIGGRQLLLLAAPLLKIGTFCIKFA